MSERDREMVESYLGVFIRLLELGAPNGANAENARHAALELITTAREEGRREPRPITDAMVKMGVHVIRARTFSLRLPIAEQIDIIRAALETAERAR